MICKRHVIDLLLKSQVKWLQAWHVLGHGKRRAERQDLLASKKGGFPIPGLSFGKLITTYISFATLVAEILSADSSRSQKAKQHF